MINTCCLVNHKLELSSQGPRSTGDLRAPEEDVREKEGKSVYVPSIPGSAPSARAQQGHGDPL